MKHPATSPHFTAAIAASFALAFWALGSTQASDVSIQKLSENTSEGSTEFFRYSIHGEAYQSAAFNDWQVLANYSGMDVAALSPRFSSSFVGIKIMPLLDDKGKPTTQITQPIFEAIAESLKNPNVRYEGTLPTLKDPVDRVDFDLRRFEGNDSWSCHYILKVKDDMLWIYASEMSPSASNDGSRIFTMLEGTFSKVSP